MLRFCFPLIVFLGMMCYFGCFDNHLLNVLNCMLEINKIKKNVNCTAPKDKFGETRVGYIRF